MLPSSKLYDMEIDATETETSKTYKLTTKKIQGTTSDIEALKQAIYKILDTEKYDYPIYSFNYGIEFNKLIGQDMTYVRIEMKRLIREALLQDDRITDVVNFNFTFEGDEVLCEFDAVTIYGMITASKGVSI
ncbi:hypothetical protein CS063_01570 [Sporanaerobium hydrogeniformans]|uniref:Uncharacterized protein n=1 Tax=Sporanaerobium hydrogeniformans TaxID=3072179 RepID=A0AC61DH60_9FIRM|nr:DUF2634 domain-containing protein [Sporanaerobium hydrogeniformans]PHV72190.1 hypothetical protein CS063_01570 [Sporanaerobium hydrogeniformans]